VEGGIERGNRNSVTGTKKLKRNTVVIVKKREAARNSGKGPLLSVSWNGKGKAAKQKKSDPKKGGKRSRGQGGDQQQKLFQDTLW